MSTITADQIELIVKAVMAELSRRAPAEPEAKELPDKGDLVIESRMITMSDVTGQLADKRRLLVPQTALITPAVIDELRRKNITLIRGNTATVKTNNLPAVLVVSGRTKQNADSVIRLLEQEGIAVRHEQSECMIASTDMLAEAVRGGNTLGVLWTRLTAMGLCLANRHQGVRAVLAGNVPDTAAAIEAVGANAIVLDPTVGTEFQRKQILRDFSRGGVRHCPESLTSRLG